MIDNALLIPYIKRDLDALGVTYSEFSKMTGIPLQTLKNIFSGKTKNPRQNTLNTMKYAVFELLTNKNVPSQKDIAIKSYEEAVLLQAISLLTNLSLEDTLQLYLDKGYDALMEKLTESVSHYFKK